MDKRVSFVNVITRPFEEGEVKKRRPSAPAPPKPKHKPAVYSELRCVATWASLVTWIWVPLLFAAARYWLVAAAIAFVFQWLWHPAIHRNLHRHPILNNFKTHPVQMWIVWLMFWMLLSIGLATIAVLAGNGMAAAIRLIRGAL